MVKKSVVAAFVWRLPSLELEAVDAVDLILAWDAINAESVVTFPGTVPIPNSDIGDLQAREDTGMTDIVMIDMMTDVIGATDTNTFLFLSFFSYKVDRLFGFSLETQYIWKHETFF